MVFFGEVWAQHEQAGQVDFTGSHGRQNGWESARESGGARPACGCVFRKAEFVDAIGVEAAAGSLAVQPARFHLGEVIE
ncbi:MAG TPA: hypothetical protein VG937_32050 [Polyangiaceae bacterium]|nr:hypothetical protein [Polyangiaceae bacterium]